MRLRQRFHFAAATTWLLVGFPLVASIVALASPASASVAREGTEVSESKLSGAGVRSGRMSWFGQYGYGRFSDGLHRHVWRDSGDNGINASGLAQMVPGIALMDRSTLGHWFEVELNGRVFLVRQVDVGPHPRTGRLIDINAPLCDMAGYSPHNFPTDRIAKWRHVGSPQQMLAMRQKPKLKQLALLETWDMGMSDQPRLAFDLVTPKLESDPPNLTRAAAKSAPWLAAAPKTVDLLTSPRHWSSVDKKAASTLGDAPMGPHGPLPTESEPYAAAEPVALTSATGPLAAMSTPPPTVTPAITRPVTRVSARVTKRYHPEPTLEDQLVRPIFRLLGIGW